MSKTEQTTEKKEDEPAQTIKLDLSDLEKVLTKSQEALFEKLNKPKAPADGKGVIEARLGPNAASLVDSLRKVASQDVKEQWSVVIPNYTSAERFAALRNFVFVSEVVKGQPGEDVTIPYVKDIDFAILSAVGDPLTEQTGIINVLTTTLKEAGKYVDVPYNTIEKIDQNLLDEINSRFAVASTRAEDKVLVELLSACTSTNFAGVIDRKTGSARFYASNIPQAIGKLLLAGKNAQPGDCVLYITPQPYAALLEELVASNAFSPTTARPDILTRGMVEEYLGVKIVVGGEVETKCRAGSGTGTFEMAFLMRGRRCLGLAPKRELLVETDRLIKEKTVRIAASHTFGVKLLDAKECVLIRCKGLAA